jgi:hypothetical protein
MTKETKEKEAAFGRILKNLPLSFGKKKAGQRKPVWGGHLLVFGAPSAPQGLIKKSNL